MFLKTLALASAMSLLAFAASAHVIDEDGMEGHGEWTPPDCSLMAGEYTTPQGKSVTISVAGSKVTFLLAGGASITGDCIEPLASGFIRFPQAYADFSADFGEEYAVDYCCAAHLRGLTLTFDKGAPAWTRLP